MARPKKKIATPEEQVQNAIAAIVVDAEYRTAATNQNQDNIEFESLIDMLECKRTEKDYDWMSDYYIPEMNSIILTDSSQWANQYFQSRDFVEVKLDGENPDDEFKAKAAKKCVNKTLNDRDLYYYPKYMRLRTINALGGKCYILAWWEQELKTETITVMKPQKMDIDIYGQPITDVTTQVPLVREMPVEMEVERPVIDRFNFDVIDPRNVFTDNKYCYTAQQKDWIIVRSEITYEELKAKEKVNNYFNLDKVKEAIKSSYQTETSKETYAKDSDGNKSDKTPIKYMDILDRYGKFWAIAEERDGKGNPVIVKPGLDTEGIPLDDAELIEMIVTFVIVGNSKFMIRFVPTPFIDAQGQPYKPIARGWCYIHPTKDGGLSDGKYMKELQIGINDTFNMSSDRVKLATLPTFKGKKYSLEDNSSVYIEPEHVIELENVDDLQELEIRDNVSGALEQLGMLTGKLQQVTATYPTTMGELPAASTTATAVAGSEVRTNARANYKSLTFEYTFLQEFYWIILQMTSRFATDETLLKMLGPDAIYFDANEDYTYQPVSSNIETEFNKHRKLQMIDQFVGRLVAVPNPKTAAMINYLMSMSFELFGKEFPQYKKILLDENVPMEGGGGSQPSKMGGPPVSNQNGAPMSLQEMGTRNNMMSGGGSI